MKCISRIILAVIVAGSGLWLLASAARVTTFQDAEVQYQRAVQLETIDGNLNSAIDLYKQVIKNNGNNRAVAAKALLRLGGCYEKQGSEQATKAYQQLLRDYADQAESAAEARTRLAAMQNPAKKESGPSTRQVWTGPDLDYMGSPSPDGKYLSFVDWNTGDLAIRDLETGENRRLTNKGPWEKSEEYAEYSRWSPDGKQIAYDWYDGKCCTDLHVIALGEGKPRILLDYNNDEWFQTQDWTPDGKQILIFVQKENGTGQIVLVSAADGTTTVVKTIEQRGLFPHKMRISRDGRYIAYHRSEEESASDSDIFLLSVDGKHETRLVKHPAHDRLLGWSPDGKGIFFSSDRTGSIDVWFIPVSGGKAQGLPEFVKGGLEHNVAMGFTRDGSFYYAQGLEMMDVYVATMDPKTGKILKPPEKAIKTFEGSNSWPDYSFDGKYLAYLTTRSHSYQANRHPNILCIRSLETGQEREFTTKFRELARPCWASDGKSIYLGAWDNQGNGIYRVNVQNGEFAPIVRVQSPTADLLYWHQISRDGHFLIYGRRDNQKEPYRILNRNLTTGEERQLYSGDRNRFSISPDGQQLALINLNKEKIVQVIPIGGGKPVVLAQFEESQNHASTIEWSADGKHIIFAKNEDQIALWRISAEGGEPQDLNLGMAGFMDLSAHPDGQHLVFCSFGSVYKPPSIWVMENFLAKEAEAKRQR